jgi:hypothetical protein
MLEFRDSDMLADLLLSNSVDSALLGDVVSKLLHAAGIANAPRR